MEDIDAMLSLGEISVAFAGFSSIVVLLKRRDVAEWQALDASRFRAMLLASLLTAFFAVLPFPLYKLRVPRDLLWSISSAGYDARIMDPRLVAPYRNQGRRISVCSAPSRA